MIESLVILTIAVIGYSAYRLQRKKTYSENLQALYRFEEVYKSLSTENKNSGYGKGIKKTIIGLRKDLSGHK